MKTAHSITCTFLFIATFLFFGSCRNDDSLTPAEESGSDEEITDPESYPDWSEETHSNSVTPDYAIVFPQNTVQRIDISISSDNWAVMQSDLAANISSSGGGPGGGPGGGMPSTSDFDPIWVPCSFTYDNTEWYQVGVRFKGNSSLRSAYQSGNNKLSFKLDFDEFEDDYPALKNQRFYGFKQLNLNNNFDDSSLLREKVVADLFRQFGLASAQTSFCALYVDKGNGPEYYGVYTIVEEVDDTVLDSQFSDGSGNLYKPDGDAASFASGTYNSEEMEKKTNEDVADYSDVKALYTIINSSTRTNDIETWKAELESILNVDGFMKWLAANTIIQNWDTYGRMTHNYYLYNNPADGLLTWIPWDNNEALQFGKQGGALSLSMDEVGNNWPLISYLVDIPEYKELYNTYLEQFINEVFIPAEITEVYNDYYTLLKDYAYAERQSYSFLSSDTDFDNGIEELKSHVQSRNDAVTDYLKQ
ncbi:CotH kinase family protein [Carboxylicivirga sp. RSCT41]|uniref:CotH kinase family protein n=1 Tax=Carboxylicivirga agarovorans TaxID=3417570 RepID=UPI003D329678